MSKEIGLYAKAYQNVAKLAPDPTPKETTGRPRILDENKVMKLWMQYEEVTLLNNIKPTVAQFCRSHGIKRRTFYCLKRRWICSGSKPAVTVQDWG